MKVLFLMFLISLCTFANFDHSHLKWNKILQQYTSKNESQVYFKYKELKKNQEALDSYLSQLESVNTKSFNTFSENQKLAFWINAYNAYTIQIILKNYPLKSIKDIRSGLFSSGPWKIDFIFLLGKKMSLDTLEHDIIRKKFKEPRIHFAVNCASIGCPSLLQEAFIAVKLEEQFTKAADNFLHNKAKNYVKADTLYLSNIFKWYGNDFEPKYGSYKNYIIKSLKLDNKNYSIKFNEYDWHLNEVKE